MNRFWAFLYEWLGCEEEGDLSIWVENSGQVCMVLNEEIYHALDDSKMGFLDYIWGEE